MTLAQKSRDFQVMIDRTFIYLAIYFRTSMVSRCKLNLLWFKTGRFADEPHLHSMKVLLPRYNHPFRFDQLHGPIRTAPFSKIKTYFEITYAFQKMPLVAEVLVWDISNYGDVSIPHSGYCKIRRLTLQFLAHKSRPLNLPDRRQRSFLAKKVHFTRTKVCANA